MAKDYYKILFPLGKIFISVSLWSIYVYKIMPGALSWVSHFPRDLAALRFWLSILYFIPGLIYGIPNFMPQFVFRLTHPKEEWFFDGWDKPIFNHIELWLIWFIIVSITFILLQRFKKRTSLQDK